MDHHLSARAPRSDRRLRTIARLTLAALLATTVVVLGLGAAPPAGAAPGDKILIYWESPGHNPDAPRAALRELATENGYTYTDTDSDADFTWDPANPTTGLGQYAAVVFVHTSGDVLNASQQAAFEAFTNAGGGSMFIHYATWGGEPDWPFYQRLAGARSGHHPERAPGTPALPGSPPGDPGTLGIIQATVKVSDTASALTAGLPASATRWDEYYDWRVNPVNTVHTLVEVDERTYSPGFTGRGGLVHPVTWCQALEGGRQWTTGLGHSAANWAYAYDDFNRAQLKLGMQYVAGDLAAPECSVPGKDVQGSWDHGIEWAGVTPWPILPINMALTADGKVQSFGARKPYTGACVPADPLVSYSLNGNPCAPDQGGQFEFDVWDPSTTRNLANVNAGLLPNTTYTDLFCSIAVLDPTRDVVYTAGGDDGLGGNAPNAGAIGVTSYSTAGGLQDEAPMNYPRWYPTATVMPNGDIVVQGGISSYSGGQPIVTPERYSPTEGNGWTVLTGATNATAYSNEQKRWWYPRSWVAPNGKLYTISGSKVYEIDPSGTGTLTMLPDLPAGIQNQGTLGTPIGATSTAVMYQPGKILQVGGGSFQNGGGPDGARAGFTVDLTTAGGTANPVFAPTQPMRYPRHWANSTILPDGRVLVSGGARQNASGMSVADGVAPAPEIWDPATGEWTSDLASYRHGRQYHSSAMLLPDGRVIMGGGGAPGPGPYTDVEFYSPDYLWNGDEPAARPTIDLAPPKVAYGSPFQISVTGEVARVTMVRAGTVTHSFNNGQAFYEPAFSVSGSTVTIEAPADGTIAPPGTWLLYVLNADGTPSVAELVEIDPATKLQSPAPVLVDQFDVPRIAGDTTIAVPAGSTHLAPWAVTSDVQLQRASSVGGLEEVGYRLNLGVDGGLQRAVEGFDPGREYRISFEYARQSGVTVPEGATVAGTVGIGDLEGTVTANPADLANGTWGTYSATFVAGAAIETLSLGATVSGTTAGLMIDNLVIFPLNAAGLNDVPIRYEFEENAGTTAANTGTETTVGAATLGAGAGSTVSWSTDGVFGNAVNLPGGNTDPRPNAVQLPSGLAQDATSWTVSLWANPRQLTNWTSLFTLSTGTDAYFSLQTKLNGGANGLGASFKAPGLPAVERLLVPPATDLTLQAWNHVAFTMAPTEGSTTTMTGVLYLNGVEIGRRTDFTVSLPDLGETTQNFLGKSAFPDPTFNGLIDDVRMYRDPLTPADVNALYAAGSALRTTTTVTTTPASPSAYGAPITVTGAVVDGAGAAVTTGKVQLTVDGAPAGEPVDLDATGRASWPVGPLPAGTHTMVVNYFGAPGLRTSAATLPHTVDVPAPPPPSDAPIHYTFDEGTGTTVQNTGSDAAVPAAQLSGTSTWTPGKYDDAVRLPGGPAGSGNWMNLPDNLIADATDFTVSMWVRAQTAPAAWTPVFNIGQGQQDFFLIQANTLSGSNGLAATFRSNNGEQLRVLAGDAHDLRAGEWVHVAVTKTGTTARIYVDGVERGSNPAVNFSMPEIAGGQTTDNYVGNSAWPDPTLAGDVDDLRIYTEALSASEIGSLYTGVVTGTDTTTTVTVTPPSPSPSGEPVTVSAAVQAVGGGAAIGSVELWIDGAKATDATFLDAAGTATFAARTLSAGDHQVEVRYSGSTGLRPSTGTTVHTVSAPPPPPPSPIHYRFDETAGTTAANSGTDPTVAAAGLSGTTTWDEAGYVAGAVRLPGGASTTTNYVNLPDNLIAEATDFTVSMWVRAAVAPPAWTPLFSIAQGQQDFFLIQANMMSGSNGLGATFRSNNGEQLRVLAGDAHDLRPGEWVHVTVTKAGTSATIYVNGVPRDTRNDVPFSMPQINDGQTTDNYVGHSPWPDPNLNASVDELRIWTQALSADQVAGLFAERPDEPLATSTAVSTSPASPSTADVPVTVSAVVSADGATPTGEAQLVIDGVAAGAPVALAADGSVTFPGQALLPGEHQVTVAYTGAVGFTPSEGSLVHIVTGPMPTTTTVATSPASPSPPGTPVVVSATVQDTQGTAAAGSVELWIDGAKVASAVLAADGSASFAGRRLHKGDHTVVVKYLGNADFLPSEATTVHRVAKR